MSKEIAAARSQYLSTPIALGSRAWCLQEIAAALPRDDAARKTLADSAARHVGAALLHVASGDYMGEHWLATFAVFLLSAPSLD